MEPVPVLEQAEGPNESTATTVSKPTEEPEIAATTTVAPEEESVIPEWIVPIPVVEPTRPPVVAEEERKRCPPCKRKSDLCEKMLENHYGMFLLLNTDCSKQFFKIRLNTVKALLSHRGAYLISDTPEGAF